MREVQQQLTAAVAMVARLLMHILFDLLFRLLALDARWLLLFVTDEAPVVKHIFAHS